MPEINLSNSKGRDAVVGSHSVQKATKVRLIDAKGRQAQSNRVVKGILSRDLAALEAQAKGRENMAKMLVEGDPEVDMEQYGSKLQNTSRVFVDVDGKIVHKVQQFEVIRNPDGTERERRPRKIAQPNTAIEVPLKWTGKLMKKSEVYNRFVFAGKRQIERLSI